MGEELNTKIETSLAQIRKIHAIGAQWTISVYLVKKRTNAHYNSHGNFVWILISKKSESIFWGLVLGCPAYQKLLIGAAKKFPVLSAYINHNFDVLDSLFFSLNFFSSRYSWNILFFISSSSFEMDNSFKFSRRDVSWKIDGLKTVHLSRSP